MRDLFLKFAENPDLKSFLAVRQAVLASEEYQPDSEELDRADELIDEGKWAEARTCLQEALPNLLLSPQAHLLMAAIAEELGEPSQEQLEDFLASTCAEGILSTGDGTKDKPYLVLRASDEYDLIEYLEKEPTDEDEVEEGDRSLDRVKCNDGSELWFDVTEAKARLAQPREEEGEESEEDEDEGEDDA